MHHLPSHHCICWALDNAISSHSLFTHSTLSTTFTTMPIWEHAFVYSIPLTSVRFWLALLAVVCPQGLQWCLICGFLFSRCFRSKWQLTFKTFRLCTFTRTLFYLLFFIRKERKSPYVVGSILWPQGKSTVPSYHIDLDVLCTFVLVSWTGMFIHAWPTVGGIYCFKNTFHVTKDWLL